MLVKKTNGTARNFADDAKGRGYVMGGSAAAGASAAVGTIVAGLCRISPATCQQLLVDAAEGVMAEYTGGHALHVVGGAAVGAAAAGKADDVVRETESVVTLIRQGASASSHTGKGIAGFNYGMTGDEIMLINSKFGGQIACNDISTLMANASNYNGLYNKSASIIRDIAGGHMFDNGNKRAAVEVFEQLVIKNKVDAPSRDPVWSVADRVAQGELRSTDEMSSALRGLK